MIYLASQSPRRKEILKKLGLKFKVVSSDYQEKHRKTSPAKLVVEHAVGKVRGVPLKLRRGAVLGADTLVYAAGQVLGKPKTQNEALKMLRIISGKSHAVYTGVALLDLSDGKIRKGFVKTRVFVKKLTSAEMISYIKKVNSYDKAGAYAIQIKPFIVEKIEGSYSNVVGLPEELVKKLLKGKKIGGVK